MWWDVRDKNIESLEEYMMEENVKESIERKKGKEHNDL